MKVCSFCLQCDSADNRPGGGDSRRPQPNLSDDRLACFEGWVGDWGAKNMVGFADHFFVWGSPPVVHEGGRGSPLGVGRQPTQLSSASS